MPKKSITIQSIICDCKKLFINASTCLCASCLNMLISAAIKNSFSIAHAFFGAVKQLSKKYRKYYLS